MNTINQIIEMEKQLQSAMLNSDVEALEKLLSNELVFTSHFGQVFTKADDLATHRSGAIKLKKLNLSEQLIKVIGNIALVNVKAEIIGNFGGNESTDILRFTRVWSKAEDGNWQVIAGHSSPVA